MQQAVLTLPRDAVVNLRSSKIREVANAGMGRDDVLAFWFGEPDEVTPEFIRTAASESLMRGETFYSHNLGLPELRAAVADYLAALHPNADAPIRAEHIAITSAGVNALSLAAQCIVNPGDRVVCVTPLWPNLVEIPKILSADVTCVALHFGERGWQLDLDELLDALTPDTRLLMVNSPNNPTGWTLSRVEQQTILAHCRKHGIWLLADDAYERLAFEEAACAPSFFDIAHADDRLVSANTFSKSWLMTGWRLGWLVAPTPFIEQLGKVIEYNTSCSPVFVQRAGIAAITGGDAVIAHTRERFRAARDHLCAALNALPGVHAPPPPGAMYAFFRVDGLTDSLAFCQRLVSEHGLGLAPGAAFGDEGEGFVRWCFASDLARLDRAVERFARGLSAFRAAATRRP
ncbi:MAG: pyridoxal phosphate-dependent aminotransferase [Burkholderiales bacterium]|nr:pyridoxal phosphate-dependent aminotransferase [Burkholderiales bacterium]